MILFNAFDIVSFLLIIVINFIQFYQNLLLLFLKNLVRIYRAIKLEISILNITINVYSKKL